MLRRLARIRVRFRADRRMIRPIAPVRTATHDSAWAGIAANPAYWRSASP